VEDFCGSAKCPILRGWATASELILEWGVGEVRPEGPRVGEGVLGEGTDSPSPPTRGFAEALSSLSGVRGEATAAEGFSCILSHQIAFLRISVHVAYSLHG